MHTALTYILQRRLPTAKIQTDTKRRQSIHISLFNQRTTGPENAHLKPDLGVLSHNEMTLTLNTHSSLLTS